MTKLVVGIMNLKNTAGVGDFSDFWLQTCHLQPESDEAAYRLPTAGVLQPLVILASERMLKAVE